MLSVFPAKTAGGQPVQSFELVVYVCPPIAVLLFALRLSSVLMYPNSSVGLDGDPGSTLPRYSGVLVVSTVAAELVAGMKAIANARATGISILFMTFASNP